MDYRSLITFILQIYSYSAKENLLVDNEADMLEELRLYKQAGGGTLCELTVTGIRINSSSLLKLSRETGVNIIHGTGFYVDSMIPEEFRSSTAEELSEIMVKEIREGIPGTGVRCGVIGEIGCSWPLMDLEKRVLRAAALAQTKTGVAKLITLCCYLMVLYVALLLCSKCLWHNFSPATVFTH